MRKPIQHILRNCLRAVVLTLLPLFAQAQCSASFEYAVYTGPIPSEGGIVFTNTSTGDYTHASWMANNIPFSESLESFTYFFTDLGFYDIVLSLWNDNGSYCNYTTTIFVGDESDICTFTSCVWPGDANTDGTANFYDILRIGTAFGATGPARPTYSTDWQAQPAPDWTQVSADGINYKHFDCNGDGQIDMNDLPVISLTNYTPLINNNSLVEDDKPVLYLTPAPGYEVTEITDKNAIYTVFVDLYLGTTNVPANQIYGLAFHADLPTDLESYITNVQFNYVNDFFGNANFVLQDLRRQGEQNDLALARTNGTNVSGFGKLGQLRFDIIGDIIDGRSEPIIEMPIFLQGIQAINNNGDDKPISVSNEVPVLVFEDQTVGIAPTPQPISSLRVEPNPANNLLRIRTEATAVSCSLINTLGQTVFAQNVYGTDTMLDIRQIPQGIYMLRVQTSKGIETQQVVIQR